MYPKSTSRQAADALGSSPWRRSAIVLAAAWFSLAPAGGLGAGPVQSLEPGRYALTIETLMPHLEVNLHYATTRTVRCLNTQQVMTLFPVMKQDTFSGCNFARGSSRGGRMDYALVCRNAEAATGTARFTVKESNFRAVLEVKMGGKNMKFSQIVSGLREGACPAAN